MTETEKDQSIASGKTSDNHSSKKKSSSKTTTRESETNGEKKRKAPKATVSDGTHEEEHAYELSPSTTVDKERSAEDQEVPKKPKKKRTSKIDSETNEIKETTDEPIKKKKSKTPKVAPVDDEFHNIEASAVNDIEPYIAPESKPKVKKTKKSKIAAQPPSDSFEELQVTNLDDPVPETGDFNPDMYATDMPLPQDTIGEYQQSIINIYGNLASKLDFNQYVGDDKWSVSHLPKHGRNDKSLIKKILPGSLKDDKKTGAQKGKLFTRFRTGVNTLVRDQNNLLFGEKSNTELNPYYDEPEEVDTDDLHRYAQKLRELEDQDREINPEFLVLHDGKTVYGVHESDADGKVTLSKRKPIYDRAADQKPDEQVDKKKLLARLKAPFSRNKDGKDAKSSSSTPDVRSHRKPSRKSINDEMATAPSEEPILI